MGNKVLTISMLVSGREDTTEKSLQSLQPLREQLGAEIILTDTGCRPEYIENIRSYADRILEFTWCNDFAKARNLGLEVADGQWFMLIDDDEWFEDVTPIIEFFQSGEYEEYNQAVYIQRNYGNFEGTEYTDEWASRMIRIESDTHFEGRVHEYLTPTRGKCKRIPAYVHHYGYVFRTEEERQAHFQRNVSILEELVKEQPNNLKWPLQLVKEYHDVAQYENMKQVSIDALQMIAHVDDFFINMCRGSFYLCILEAEMQASDYESMWQNYSEFIKNEKNPWNVRCAMAVYMLLHVPEQDESRLELCAKEYVDAIEVHKQDEYTEQQEVIAESIVFVSEYMKKLPQYMEGLQQAITGNGEFLFLPERVWMLARLGVLPLEDLLLGLPVAQWIVQMQILQTQGFSAKWSVVGSQLASICTRNDIRYMYFDRVLEIVKMKQIYHLKENVEKMDLAFMTRILTEFAQANLNYMDYMYTEAAFEGNMELLSQEEKASMWIANGLSMDDTQWREKLQCFSEAAKECSMLADFMKKYIQLYGNSLVG